jgi:hypothetical protein
LEEKARKSLDYHELALRAVLVSALKRRAIGKV